MQCSHLGSLESDSHSFGQSSILAVTDNDSSRSKTQRKVSREKKRGSHGWKREREETLPSPSSFLAVGKEGKKRGQIGNISASKGSRAVVWGRRKNATLSLPQTGLSARRFFFFFPQRGAWSQITWFLPLLLSLRFVILRYNSKYQSKGQIYILHLFAFQKK